MAEDSSVMRPCLLGTDGLHHATISGLTMLNSPNWFNLIANSTDILISNMTMLVESEISDAPAKVRLIISPLFPSAIAYCYLNLTCTVTRTQMAGTSTAARIS